jgi:hypothetical protein
MEVELRKIEGKWSGVGGEIKSSLEVELKDMLMDVK